MRKSKIMMVNYYFILHFISKLRFLCFIISLNHLFEYQNMQIFPFVLLQFLFKTPVIWIKGRLIHADRDVYEGS